MPIKTAKAIEEFGTKINICRALEIREQNATHWGYFIPHRHETKMREFLSSIDVEEVAMHRLTRELVVGGIDTSIIAEINKADNIKKKTIEIELDIRKKMHAVFDDQEDFEITEGGVKYEIAVETDDALKLQSALKRGDALYFFNHDEMMPASDFNLKRCLELFKLYPIYKKVV